MPSKFYYHVVCDGYAHISTDDTVIAIWTNADSTEIDWNTIRFYRRVEYTGIHTERVYYLGPGSHTFYFVGDRYWGTGEERINYYTITVTVYTDGQSTVAGGTVETGVDPTGSK